MGVAVPSSRFFVRGPMRSMKSSRLFGSLLLLAQPATPAGLVGLVEDDCAVLAFEQILAFLGVVENQAGRDDGDAERATRDVLGPRVLMMWPLGSIHTFFVEDQTALGMPSLSFSSTCH